MSLKNQKTKTESKNLESIKNLEYNTQRERIFISEYGRSVQKMVESAMTITDKEKRTKAAHGIVNVMALLNPQVREIADFKQKLWDHLFIISDFKLDVDSPYPIPEKSKIKERPKPLKYPGGGIKYKYYGRVMEDMIRNIAKLPEGPVKDQIVHNLANFMKMSYLTWNKDTVDDSTIINHLDELSGGKLKLHESVTLNHTAEILAMNKEKMQRENANRNKGRILKNKRRKK
jgi:hypothetical protein